MGYNSGFKGLIFPTSLLINISGFRHDLMLQTIP